MKPSMAAAKEWYVKTPNIVTIAFGVDAPAETTIFIPIMQDGVGNSSTRRDCQWVVRGDSAY
jgi:hypothetical protein